MAAALAITTVVVFATPASGQDEFVAERSASFDLKAFGQGEKREGCTGEVWAGRTGSGSVQATTTVRCSDLDGDRELLRQRLATSLSIYPPGEVPAQFDWESGCDACPSSTVAGSEPGGPGWCAFGLADEVMVIGRAAVEYTGSAVVCV